MDQRQAPTEETEASSQPINWLALAAVISGITGVGLALSLSLPLLSIVLERRGISASLVGLNTATAGVAAIIVLPFVTAVAVRVGTANLIILSFAVMCASLMGFYYAEEFLLWFPLRFAFAAAVTASFALTEFWINSLAPDSRRGLIVGVYTAFLSVGIALGPLILALVGTEGIAPFLCGAAALAVAALPVALVRGQEPELHGGVSNNLLRFLWLTPRALVAASVFGAVESGGTAILPLYGTALGRSSEAAVVLVSAIAVGNVLSQIPIGYLADKMDRRLLLILCSFIGALGAIALPFVSDNYTALLVVLFITGGIVAGLYTVGLTHLGARYKGAELAEANAAFVMMYAIGMLIGPVTLGAGLDVWEPHGFAVAIAVIFIAYVVLGLVRLSRAGRA